MACYRIPGVEYPREVPILPGMPEGWKGIEKCYGEASKMFGQVYTRYSSSCGKHRGVGSPAQVIKLHCEELGTDPTDMLLEYERIKLERKDKEIADRAEEQASKGVLKGDVRDLKIEKFREVYGPLEGPVVFCFPGWKTVWSYLPVSNQVFITYVEPSGQEWKILKNLEAALQHRMDIGVGGDIPAMLEEGRGKADPAKFSCGTKNARETQGTCEIEGGAEFSEVQTRSLLEIDGVKQSFRKTKRKKTHSKDQVWRALEFVNRVGPSQTGWATLATQEHVEKALSEFRRLMVECKFPEETELVAVHGCSTDRHYANRVIGVYYEMAERCEGRRCYQKLLSAPGCTPALGCDDIYVVWSPSRAQWQMVTKPEDGGVCIAFCNDSAEQLGQVSQPWNILESNGNFEDCLATLSNAARSSTR